MWPDCFSKGPDWLGNLSNDFQLSRFSTIVFLEAAEPSISDTFLPYMVAALSTQNFFIYVLQM